MAITTITPVVLTGLNTFIEETSGTDFAALDATLGAKIPVTKRDEKLLIGIKHVAASGATLTSITTAPSDPTTGDKYYKAADDKIYTYGAADWDAGAAPSATLIYVFNNKFYMFVTDAMVEVFPTASVVAGSYLQSAFGNTTLALTPGCIAWIVVDSGRHLNSDGYIYITSNNGRGAITATVQAMAVRLP
jgi:hypothetical protein